MGLERKSPCGSLWAADWSRTTRVSTFSTGLTGLTTPRDSELGSVQALLEELVGAGRARKVEKAEGLMGLEAVEAALSVWSLQSSLVSLGDTGSSSCLGSIFTSYFLDSLADLTLRNLGLGRLAGKEMLLLMDLRMLEVLDLILPSPWPPPV